MWNGPEVVAQGQSVNVADRGQVQVHLQSLLAVLPFDLQRYADALTFTLLQPGQVYQEVGTVLFTIAPKQSNSCPNQAR